MCVCVCRLLMLYMCTFVCFVPVWLLYTLHSFCKVCHGSYMYIDSFTNIYMCVCTQILHSKHTNTLRAEVVTSIWGNGDTGPLFVHLPESSSSAHIVADLNAKFGGKLKVVISRTGSHFMNAEATIVYYEEPSAQVVYIGAWGV